MKIKVVAEHDDGTTQNMCVIEIDTVKVKENGGLSPNEMDETWDAVKHEINFFLKGQSWFRQGNK